MKICTLVQEQVQEIVLGPNPDIYSFFQYISMPIFMNIHWASRNLNKPADSLGTSSSKQCIYFPDKLFGLVTGYQTNFPYRQTSSKFSVYKLSRMMNARSLVTSPFAGKHERLNEHSFGNWKFKKHFSGMRRVRAEGHEGAERCARRRGDFASNAPSARGSNRLK